MRARFSKIVGSAGLAFALLGPVAVASASPPVIESQWVSNVTARDATLNAVINPSGLPTQYKLQIDTTGHFKFDQNDSCSLHPFGVGCFQALVAGEPLARDLVEPKESSLAADTVGKHVSVRMAAIGATLQPETTYHYRAIAASGVTVVEGPDETFTTPAEPPVEEAGAPPAIESLSVSGVTSTDATLEATIDPNGLETEYTFYVTDPCPPPPPGGASCQAIATEMVSGTIADGDDPVSVTEVMSRAGRQLTPNTKHQTRLVVSNSAGSSTEDGLTFWTLALGPSPGGGVLGKESPGEPKGPFGSWPIVTLEPPRDLPPVPALPPAADQPPRPNPAPACKRKHRHKARKKGLGRAQTAAERRCRSIHQSTT